MKRTHTKNLLSMAPTLHMFTNQKQKQKQRQKQQTEATVPSSKASNIKYNRSISSFRKINRESPQKKYGLSSKSRPTLPRGVIDGNPYEKIIEIFNHDVNARSQQQLFDDFISRIDGSLRVLQDSMQSQIIIKVFSHIKKYGSKIFGLLLKVVDKKLANYIQQLGMVCAEYEKKLKEVQLQQSQKLRNKIMKQQSQFSKKIYEMHNKQIFSTQIHDQMQRNHIDLTGWIKQSQTFDTYVYNLQHNSQSLKTGSVIINQPINPQKFRDKNKQSKNMVDSVAKGKKQYKTGAEKTDKLIASNKPTAQLRIEEELQFEESMFGDQMVGGIGEKTMNVSNRGKGDRGDNKLNRSN